MRTSLSYDHDGFDCNLTCCFSENDDHYFLDDCINVCCLMILYVHQHVISVAPKPSLHVLDKPV